MNQDVFILTPNDARCYGWQMSADITSPEAAREIAAHLIPENKQGGNGTFFDRAAQDLVYGEILGLIASGEPWDLHDLLCGIENIERLTALSSVK